MKKVVIYTRVSTDKQERDGNGLQSQEKTCRRFAENCGFREIDQVFSDIYTGKTIDRPEFKKMMAYCENHKKGGTVIITTAQDRCTRSIRDSQDIYDLNEAYNIVYMSPSGRLFDPSENGRTTTGLQACVSESERRKYATRSGEGMQHQISQGIRQHGKPSSWYQKSDDKIIRPVEPNATIVKFAWEAIAAGTLKPAASQISTFLYDNGYEDKNTGEVKKPSGNIADSLLNKKSLMEAAGLLWDKTAGENGEWIKALHPAIIDEALAHKVLERTGQKIKRTFRGNHAYLFPLRGDVLCESCGHPLTSDIKKKYKYYVCIQKYCRLNKKTIKADNAHKSFENRLKTIHAPDYMQEITTQFVLRDYKHSMKSLDDKLKRLKREVGRLDKESEKISGEWLDASASIRRYLNKQMEENEVTKKELLAKISDAEACRQSPKRVLHLLEDFLQNPFQAWKDSSREDKQILQKQIFGHRFTYSRENGFEDAKVSPIYTHFIRQSDEEAAAIEQYEAEWEKEEMQKVFPNNWLITKRHPQRYAHPQFSHLVYDRELFAGRPN